MSSAGGVKRGDRRHAKTWRHLPGVSTWRQGVGAWTECVVKTCLQASGEMCTPMGGRHVSLEKGAGEQNNGFKALIIAKRILGWGEGCTQKDEKTGLVAMAGKHSSQ